MSRLGFLLGGRKFIGEFLGTAILVCAVVGSGIMGTLLSDDPAVALLVNSASTSLALGVLMFIIGPISGANLNPLVSLVLAKRECNMAIATFSSASAQISGAIVGAMLANLMFELPWFQISDNDRAGFGALIGEVIATAGLISIVLILIERSQERLLPLVLPAWIGSAYFFTSSTSFANPAVTIGRIFSDTFSGINPTSVLPFLLAQIIGAAFGILFARGARNVP